MAIYQARPHPTDTSSRHDDRYLTEDETLLALSAKTDSGGSELTTAEVIDAFNTLVEPFAKVTVDTVAPEDPAEGDIWVNTETAPIIQVWSELDADWIEIVGGVSAGDLDAKADQTDLDATDVAVAYTNPGSAGTAGQYVQLDEDNLPAWKDHPYIDLSLHLDPLSSDHQVALQTIVDANGPGTYLIPAGFEITLPLGLTADVFQFRDGVRIVGEGPTSVINVTGFALDPGDTHACMAISWTVQDGDIRGAGLENLTVQGDGDPDMGWTDFQANAVKIESFGDLILDTVIRGVIFKDIDGFPIHSDGYTERNMLVEYCTFDNCSNGPNTNGSWTTFQNNYLTNCEGIECSGPGTKVIHNTFVDIFQFAISLGGDFSTGGSKKTLPSQQACNNFIFGVRGGAGLGLGHGIVTSQSSPDCLIGWNYIERTYGQAIITTHDATTGPDDGHTIIGNTAVNCSASATRLAFYNLASNTRWIGNRYRNRVALAADPYPTTGYGAQRAFQADNCDNVFLDGNDFDMAVNPTDVTTQYAMAFNGVTNIRLGQNRLVPNSGYPVAELINTCTCADGSGLNRDTLNTSDNNWNTIGFRWIKIDTTGGAKNIILQKASVSNGAEITITAPAGATNALTVLRNGSDTINGVAADKALSSNYAQIKVHSDGTGWIIDGIQGTVT